MKLEQERFPLAPADIEVFVAGHPFAKNVLVFTEHLNATYFISFDIPLRRLNSSGAVNFAAVSQKGVAEAGSKCWERWTHAFRPDIVIMTRYGQGDGLEILSFFQGKGIPVVYHIDDDLLELPASLGEEIQKRHGQVAETRRQLLSKCDLIYASTAHLAEVLQQRFPAQRIYHGIYAPYMEEALRSARSAAKPRQVIGYMGSKGHQHDLQLAIPAVERLLDERPELEFEVFGSIVMPDELRRFGKRVRHHSVQKSYEEFLASLAGLGWGIGLAPLVEEPFNRCKAPTKFIEYTAAGIPTMASCNPVYGEVIPENAGYLVRDQDWYTGLRFWLDQPQARSESLSCAQAYCEQTFSIARLTEQVAHVLNLASEKRESVQVYVGADRSQQLAIKVLEHSIRRYTRAHVKVHPMVDLAVPVPKDPRNGQRTGFSFSRFCIPELTRYQGRAIYLDADMLVFKDILGLWNLPFDGKKVLVQTDVQHLDTSLHKENAPPVRKKQCSVMLLDCARLTWSINQVVRDLDEKRYDYPQLLEQLALEPEDAIGFGIPFEWNSLEYYGPETCLIHYTDMGTQPWVSTRNPNAYLWVNELRAMLADGSLTLAELNGEVRQGYFRPSLLRELRFGHRVPAMLKGVFNALNSMLDRLQGYVPHRAVYAAKKARQQAMALKATSAAPNA